MPPVATEPMLIESAMPQFATMIAEHVVVAADVPTTFDAAVALDLLTVRIPLLGASMWMRGLPALLLRRSEPSSPRLVIGEGITLPGWLVLGERANPELAFGVVGKFWQPVIDWRDVPATDFPSFAEPGWGKIAANFSVAPNGQHHTLLSYQCRTVTTDPASRRRFMRYWRLIRPFVRHIMRATLNSVKADAEAAAQLRRK